jgi:hypothetical protein
MSDQPSRRRFQFRLRTLMIGVALFGVFGGWFGSQVRVVQERKALASRAGVDSHTTDARGRLSWIRVWLGDKYFRGLLLDRSLAEESVLYKNAFPEATILQRESSDFYELLHRLHASDSVQATR